MNEIELGVAVILSAISAIFGLAVYLSEKDRKKKSRGTYGDTSK